MAPKLMEIEQGEKERRKESESGDLFSSCFGEAESNGFNRLGVSERKAFGL
jgi:hypothetical protein